MSKKNTYQQAHHHLSSLLPPAVADCDYDIRNVLSWRVPNDLTTFRSPSNTSNHTHETSTRSADSHRLSKASRPKHKKDSAIAIVIPDHSTVDTPNIDNVNSNCQTDEGVLKINLGNKLWKVLFSNVNRSIDELYDMCEEEEDEQRCKDAIDIMERSSRDFRKLIERIEEQKRFDASKGPLSGGISWEVRKPTNTPPKSATLIIQVDQSATGENSLQASISHPVETSLSSSLRATAQPFQPTLAKSDVTAQKTENPLSNNTNTKVVVVKKESVEVQTDDTSVGVATAKASSQDNLQFRRANLSRSGSSVCSNKSSNSTGKAAKQAARNASTRGTAHTQMDKWDEHTHMEVTTASEKVWAEAEAWVDAEAAAEENEWRMMEKTVNKLSAKSWDSAMPAATTTFATSSNVSRSLDALDKIPVVSDIGRHSRAPDRGDSATVFASAPTASRDDKENIAGDVIGSARCPTKAEVSTTAASLVIDTVELNGQQASKRSSPVLLKFSPTAVTTGKKKPFPVGVSPSDGVLATPSPSSQFTYPGSSGGRTLHDKLSSPDRKRDLSPAEALRIHEARQIAAETNRDKSMAEKVQKAMIASTRVKLRGEKEAQRLLLKEQALEEKLKDAELRHTKHIKQIKGKAGNENAKVNEVIFINSLNSEGIAEQLQQKLEEVEARILAASERRQQRLAGIGNRERKKNTKKANQMCELRLALERQKMERWEKLQKRLHAVQQRRAARLEEIQRRCDEAATLHGSEVSSLFDVTAAFETEVLVPPDHSGCVESTLPVPGTAGQGDNKSAGVLMLLKSKSKSKMKKGKSRKAKTKNISVDTIAPSDVSALPMLSRSTDNVTNGGRQLPVLAACPADCLEEGYKSMQASLSKKQLKTARESCSLPATTKVENANGREGDASKPVLAVDHSQMSMTDWIAIWTSKKSASEGISLVETIFTSLSEIFPIGSADSSATGSMLRIFSERENGHHHRTISELTSILEAIVSTEGYAEISEFIDHGGIFILRILLGSEVGLVSTNETFVRCLSLSFETNGTSDASKLYNSFWITLLHALERCCCVPSGVISAITSGIFPLLSDILIAIMAARETYRKGKVSSHSGSSLFFDDTSTAGTRKLGERRDEDSASLYNDFDKHIYGHRPSVAHKNVIDWLVPSVLFSISQLLIFSGDHLSSAEPAQPNYSHYVTYMDAFVWYLISSNHLGNLVHSLRMMESDAGLDDQGVLSNCSHFIFCANVFISSCCSYLSATTPLTLVPTMTQLSNRTLRHPRGKLIVSLVRKSEVAASLLHIMDRCRSAAGDVKAAAASPTNAAIFFSFANAFAHLSTMDISIVQQFSDEQQAIWNRTFHFAVALALDLVKSASKEAARKPPDDSSGLPESDLMGFFLRHRLLQRAGWHAALRCSSSGDVMVGDAENGLAVIVKAAGLACLRCPSMQKVCGMQNVMGALRPASLPHQATLQSICKLSTKYFKDKRFKHSLLPALISMCLDVDSNIFLLRMENKVSYIVKYLELHLRQVDELNRPPPPQTSSSSSSLSSSAASTSSPPASASSPKASLSVQLSQVLPVDLWNISLITLSS